MLSLLSVNNDHYIPNWHNPPSVLKTNVLALIVQGKVRYTIDHQPFVGEQGELLFIPCGTLRASENYEGDHHKYTILFDFDGADELRSSFLGAETFNTFKIRSFESIKRRFEMLYVESVGEGNYRRTIASGIFHELVGLLAREFETVEMPPAKLRQANEMQNYLINHYRESILIDRIARLINRSNNYAISLFREVIGLSPIQYVHQLRIREACRLLTESDLSVTEIAGYLGYYDHPYFFRMFKKYTALSPSEYRHALHVSKQR